MSKRGGDRRLAAVLFTDIVSSTDVASELGDTRWLRLLARHHRIVRAHLKLFGGHEQDTAGDGFFATFDVPADAVRCAAAAQREIRELGIEIRAGVNFGEVEIVDSKPGGIAVHAGARIMSASTGGVVMVSSSVKELLAGAGIGFEDAGTHHLKGLDEDVHLYRVTRIDDDPVTSPETDDAAARARRDAIVEAGASRRRSRWLVVLVASLVVLVAGAVVLATRDDGGAPAADGPPRAVLVGLDPTTGVPQRVIPIEVQQSSGAPGQGDGAAGQGGVWLPRNANLVHVDPAHEEQVSISLGITGYLNIDTGFDRVWATVSGVVTANPATDELTHYVDRIAAGGAGQWGHESDLVVGNGAVWVSMTDGRLVRVDPSDPGATRAWQLTDGQLDGLAVGDGAVWGFDSYAGEIVRFDPETGRADQPIHESGSVDEIAFAGSDLWILDRSAGTVTPLGSSTSVQVGSAPTSMVAGFDAVWVGDDDGTVYRIDPLTEEVTPVYRAGGTIESVIADPDLGVLWLDVGARA
ncbi:MAG: adenylate/guanylate cyclase domain-containing protein [Actinomycetota bacterium]